MAEAMSTAKALEERLREVERLVRAVEACPDPGLRDQARELVGTLMDFHGAALARLLELFATRGEGAHEWLEELGRDPAVSALLLLHGLHPRSLEARVNDALEEVRPTLGRHSGDVELLAIEAGTVRLRLKGTCHGCPSSASTMKNLIEGAIQERAPEIEQILVEGMVRP